MRAIFLGRKPAASVALRSLIDFGIDVAAVVAPDPAQESPRALFWRPLLRTTAEDLGLPVVTPAELMAAAKGRSKTGDLDLGNVDLVLSFLYWKKIPRELIDLPRIGCFNFHPAPLPEYRGRRGYNFAILEGAEEYGASVHWVSEQFDGGEIVEVRHFPIRPAETAFSLEARTMSCLVDIFEDFIRNVLAGRSIEKTPQGPGKSATKAEMLAAMHITPADDPDTIERKVRAFWYPPHTGATIELGGRQYTLVDETTLSTLGRFLHGSRATPW